MNYTVNILIDAEDDIVASYEYVAQKDSPGQAAKLSDQLKTLCCSLDNNPHRGHVPPELSHVSVLTYLEVHYKPYRVIYQIVEDVVYIHAVLDGRRDLQTLLVERLVR